ncbi:MAG: Flp pilus assembly protein CpaB [Actinomycetota bacterium]|nr:Flp pilus assembly protein CpaB [Actinomycetota bacterium]
MGNRRVLILVAAIGLAAVTAFATFNYVSSADERALGDAELVEVFMVKQDIEKGLPGERALDEGFITKDRIPKKFYPAKAVVNVQTLRGKVALAPLAAGIVVVDGSFVEPRLARESFAQRIDKGMQAVTLSVSDVQGVARLVVPGDKVNMLITTTLDPNAGPQTQFVLQALEVLAVGNATELQPGEVAPAAQSAAGTAQTADSGLITFAVPALEAERVVHASQAGTIHLTLVPPDFTPAPVPPVNRANLFA